MKRPFRIYIFKNRSISSRSVRLSPCRPSVYIFTCIEMSVLPSRSSQSCPDNLLCILRASNGCTHHNFPKNASEILFLFPFVSETVDSETILFPQSWIDRNKRRINLFSAKLVDLRLIRTTHIFIILVRLPFPVPPIQIPCVIDRLVFIANEKCRSLII